MGYNSMCGMKARSVMQVIEPRTYNMFFFQIMQAHMQAKLVIDHGSIIMHRLPNQALGSGYPVLDYHAM